MIRWLVLSLSRAVQPRCKPVNQKKMDSMRPSFYEFKTNYDSQPEKWKKRLMAIYKTDQEAAIAAWTLIMSMDDLMLEVEETAIFLDQIYSKNWVLIIQANQKESRLIVVVLTSHIQTCWWRNCEVQRSLWWRLSTECRNNIIDHSSYSKTKIQ